MQLQAILKEVVSPVNIKDMTGQIQSLKLGFRTTHKSFPVFFFSTVLQAIYLAYIAQYGLNCDTGPYTITPSLKYCSQSLKVFT